MDQQQQARWQPTRRQLMWAGGIATLAFLLIVIGVYFFGWGWTGLSEGILWDWLNLLIVPAMLVLGGYLFTRSERQATEAAAEQRAQEEALQAYLDQMGQLLLDEDQPLRQSAVDSEVGMLAQAHTLTAGVFGILGGVVGAVAGALAGLLGERWARGRGEVRCETDWRPVTGEGSADSPGGHRVLDRNLKVTLVNDKDIPVTVWEMRMVFYKGG